MYNFDKITNRRGTNSYKWDSEEVADALPMWVADMDFEVAPCVTEALHSRVDHGIFGYTQVPESYYEAIISWFRRRHGWTIDRRWIQYTSGVVPAMSCTIKALCMPGEKVLVQTPVYNCFFSSIKNNGCEVLENELLREGDTYKIDFDDLERKCADEKTTLFVLCNPHNPAGRVWTKQELACINDICMRHHVRVVSDEIHGEIVMPGYTYVPYASVSAECLQNSITLTSPTKGFNMAGLQIANIICSDAETRRRIDRAININEVCDVNPFGPIALQAAYNDGEAWLDEMNSYVWGNYQQLKAYFAEQLPMLNVVKMEGTYLAWVDISALQTDADSLTELLLHKGKVLVNSGTMYGEKAGKDYIRINLACPRARLMDGLERIVRCIKENR